MLVGYDLMPLLCVYVLSWEAVCNLKSFLLIDGRMGREEKGWCTNQVMFQSPPCRRFSAILVRADVGEHLVVQGRGRAGEEVHVAFGWTQAARH